ncbi:MAG: VOC family protein [Oscillospiraceae bacterium]
MALTLGGWCVVLDSGNAEELSLFYEKLLGWTRLVGEEFITLSNLQQAGFPTWITFQQIDGYTPPVWPAVPGKQQQMEHLDFHVENMEEGVQHALACGATLAETQLEEELRVMLDPAGHPFCILPKPAWMNGL